MRRLIKFGVAFGLTCAVLFLGGASFNPTYVGNKTQYQFSWHRGTSKQGNMILDSCARSDTSDITSMFYNADSAMFKIFCTAGDTAGSDTATLCIEGLDAFGNVLHLDTLHMDTLNDSIQDNYITVYSTAMTAYPYVRLTYAKVDADTAAGDSTVVLGYRKGDNIP